MDTLSNCNSWSKSYVAYGKLLYMVVSFYGVMSIHDRHAQVQSCLMYHRGDRTKALRFLGHAIALHKEVLKDDLGWKQIQEQLSIFQDIKQHIKNLPLKFSGENP